MCENLKEHIKEVIKKNNHIIITETTKDLVENLTLLEISTLDQLTKGMLWIKENNIDGVIIGGTAVAYYIGKSRTLTPDIDYLVTNINSLKNKLTDSDLDFEILKGYDSENLGIFSNDFNIDFLDSSRNTPELYSLILKDYNTITIAGESFKIISPELLTIMKLNLGREKDLNDGFTLLKSGKLNTDKYIKYVDLLKSKLEDYESIKSYSDIIS